MVARALVLFLVCFPWVGAAVAQAALTTPDPGRADSVSLSALRAQRDWAWPKSVQPEIPGAGREGALPKVQQAQPGWLEGEAAAGSPVVTTRRVLGIIGGMALGFFGTEAAVQDNEPAFFGWAALAGGGIVLMSAMSVGSSEPDAATMQEVSARGDGYRRAFLEGYSSGLRSRRERAGLGGGALGFGIGVGMLFLAASAFCGGDC